MSEAHLVPSSVNENFANVETRHAVGLAPAVGLEGGPCTLTLLPERQMQRGGSGNALAASYLHTHADLKLTAYLLPSLKQSTGSGLCRLEDQVLNCGRASNS